MGYGWFNSRSSATYTVASTNSTFYPTTIQPTYTGRLVFNDVQVEPPVPQTEVEKLLREVEDVCALAR